MFSGPILLVNLLLLVPFIIYTFIIYGDRDVNLPKIRVSYDSRFVFRTVRCAQLLFRLLASRDMPNAHYDSVTGYAFPCGVCVGDS